MTGDRYRSLGSSVHHGVTRLEDDEVDVPAAPSGYLGTMRGRHGLAPHAEHEVSPVGRRDGGAP